MSSPSDVFSPSRRWRRLGAGALTAALLASPAALAITEPLVPSQRRLADFDARVGLVPPSAAQQDAVRALGARATWNRFGTPASLLDDDGFLGAVTGADVGSGARAWVREHRDLFRLTDADVTALELVHALRLTGTSSAYSVLFRQRFGGLSSAQDGMIALGVVDGKVAYVSSSAVGSQSAPAPALLTPAQAWVAAARSVGRAVDLSALSAPALDGTWTRFDVPGFAQPQRARPVAFALPGGGVRAAFETVVLDVEGGEAIAYTAFVDGRSGEVLFRQDQVKNLEAASTTTSAFQGTLPTTAGVPGCAALAPFEAPAGTRTIAVSAHMALATNDLVLNLRRHGATGVPVTVASADTATSPEALTYAPPDTAGGTYSVEVCPYTSPTVPLMPPYDFAGTVTTSDASTSALDVNPAWRLFTANPPFGTGEDTRTLACWLAPRPGEACGLVLRNVAARAPWDYDLRLNAPTFTTLGNAASTAEAWASPLTPAEQVRPVSAERRYDFPWTNQWFNQKCSPAALASPERNDVDAATANLFALHNRMHDWSYLLGFTETAYNLQDSNFGNTPASQEHDRELGNVQAGALSGGAPSYLGRDNANQITLNDGIPGITNMYLWQPIAGAFYPPCVDGDYDMSVVGHEYTHAISNRMVGGPDSNLTGLQAGSMGESWSDLTAMEYLLEHGFVPVAGESPYAIGAYVTGSLERGIRNFALDANPLNYSNVGYDVTGAEVHADGEIWNAIQFELRRAFVAAYDAQFPSSDAALQRACAAGERTADQCPGNRRWMQLVFDAYLLMQPSVSMVDARDAMLAADRLRFGGANQTLLWRAFARRGLGERAFSASSDDADPTPSFETPRESNEAALTFRVVAQEGGQPVAARVFVGRFEARSTPVADTDPATALGDTARLVPGTYDLLVQAPGYGQLRFALTASSSRTVTVALPTNLVSATWRAGRSSHVTASGAGGTFANLGKLVDDSEETNFAHLGAEQVEGTEVTATVKDGPQVINRVQVSALLRPADSSDPGGDTGGQNRFTALRQFQVLGCKAAYANDYCQSADGFTVLYTSPADALPGGAPRPTAPDLDLRSFDLPPTEVTHVKLRVLSNQCTGGPAFQGDQDADPSNDSACLRSASAKTVRISELQVFKARGTVNGATATPASGTGGAGKSGSPADPAVLEDASADAPQAQGCSASGTGSLAGLSALVLLALGRRRRATVRA